MGANDRYGRPSGHEMSLESMMKEQLNRLIRRHLNECLDNALVANGTTAGNVKTTNAISYRNGGQLASLAASDDFWDLSGETDTTAAQYRGYLLLVDGGVASFVATANCTTAALAIAALEALIPEAKAVVGVFVADPSCDFDAGGGLAAQGTYYQGLPEALTLGECVAAL